jgi:CRISPR-associated protein (TIGR03986 family)
MIRHKNPTIPNRTATAPYNFVRLSDKIFVSPEQEPPSRDRFHTDRHTGYFEIKLKALTQIYTRYAPFEEAIEQSTVPLPFFHHADQHIPVIDGSSLRGMIRNLVSTMSFGKLRRPSKKTLFYRNFSFGTSLYNLYTQKVTRRVAGRAIEYPINKIKAGYLDTSNPIDWKIIPATEHYEESFILVERETCINAGIVLDPQQVHDQEVYVEPRSRANFHKRGPKKNIVLSLALTNVFSTSKGGALQPGTLLRSGNSTRKHMDVVIYASNPRGTRLEISPELQRKYSSDTETKRADETPTRKLGKGPKGPYGEPVFYLLDDKKQIVFIGPTMMMRLPHSYTIHDLAPQEEKRDLAEIIFGEVFEVKEEPAAKLPKKDAEQVMGRVVFHQSVCTEQPTTERRPLEIALSGPKPTAHQMYLTQDQPDDKGKLRHYSEPNARLRGKKYYWHSRNFNQSNSTANSPISIQPVNKGAIFSGKISFENLSDLELGALIAALELPEGYAHKIGMGKPLGLGSIRISTKLIILDHQKRFADRAISTDGCLVTGVCDETNQVKAKALETYQKLMCEHQQAIDPSFTGDFEKIPHLQRDLMPMLLFGQTGDTNYMRSPTLDRHTREIWANHPVLPTPDKVANLNLPEEVHPPVLEPKVPPSVLEQPVETIVLPEPEIKVVEQPKLQRVQMYVLNNRGEGNRRHVVKDLKQSRPDGWLEVTPERPEPKDFQPKKLYWLMSTLENVKVGKPLYYWCTPEELEET